VLLFHNMKAHKTLKCSNLNFLDSKKVVTYFDFSCLHLCCHMRAELYDTPKITNNACNAICWQKT
jgi:hypothetical protein